MPLIKPSLFLFVECRMEMFSSLLGRHMAANRLDSLPISAIEGIVNSGAAVPYSQEEIESLLEVRYLQ